MIKKYRSKSKIVKYHGICSCGHFQNFATATNYVLNFKSSAQLFKKPRIRSLRIIDSLDNYKNAGKVFCSLQGLDDGHSYSQIKEYIGTQAEQFYDIATNSIVYKTDEDVTIIDGFSCQPKEFSTEDY